jgi:hypothetical protein
MPANIESPSLRAGSLRSSGDSILSYDTQASSIATHQLGPLQTKGPVEDADRLSPLLEDDPRSYELVAPITNPARAFDLESRSEQLFSRQHLQAIFHDTPSLLRFTSFLSTARPKSVPLLVYYLDALKAMRAIHYANAVAEALEPIAGQEFTEHPPRSTLNAVLEDKAQQAFDILVREELPAFITHVFTQHVSVSVQKRVTGNLPPMLREASEGLAEVFCVSDPSRPDNPIIFASEGVLDSYFLGVRIASHCIRSLSPAMPHAKHLRIPPHNPIRRQLRHRPKLPLPPGPNDEPQQRHAPPQRCHRGQRSQRGLAELVRLPRPLPTISHCMRI